MTAIKLDGGRALVIKRAPDGAVLLSIIVGGFTVATQRLTPEAAAGVIHGLECALEVAP